MGSVGVHSSLLLPPSPHLMRGALPPGTPFLDRMRGRFSPPDPLVGGERALLLSRSKLLPFGLRPKHTCVSWSSFLRPLDTGVLFPSGLRPSSSPCPFVHSSFLGMYSGPRGVRGAKPLAWPFGPGFASQIGRVRFAHGCQSSNFSSSIGIWAIYSRPKVKMGELI